jgi:aromatic-L-amino-acid decarboxylase
MNHEAFRAAGHQLIDQITDYWATIEQRRVSPTKTRETLFAEFADTLSGPAIGLEAGVRELPTILNAAMAMSHPLYLGLVNSSPMPAGVLGELIVSALDNNGGASHQGPAQAAAENELIRQLASRLDYDGHGMLLAGGTYASLQALQLAKAHALPEWIEEGPLAVHAQPRLYYSDSVHFSVDRAAQVIGLGKASLAPLPSLGRGELNPDVLEEMIKQDRRAGHRPFAVVATAGTTGTGAIDPLQALADLCERHDVWFHVDACYGGAAALLDDLRPRFSGIERADSLCVDLHKWFFMPLTAGILLTRHESLAESHFGIQASYIPDVGFAEAYRRGIPTSRRGSALAAWFSLRTMGWECVTEAIERNIALTRRLEQLLAERGFRVMPDGELSIACARWEPAGLEADPLDRLQVQISEAVCRAGTAWFATTRHAGQTWLRFNMVNLNTRSHHMDQLAEAVTLTAKRLAS